MEYCELLKTITVICAMLNKGHSPLAGICTLQVNESSLL